MRSLIASSSSQYSFYLYLNLFFSVCFARYGWSFFTAGLGFLISEIAAVVGITLFLSRYEKLEDMVRIIPGLEEKVDPELLYQGRCGVHCQMFS